MSVKDQKEEVVEVVEESAVPTAELGFREGVLHQKFVVQRSDGSATPEWRPVPTLSS